MQSIELGNIILKTQFCTKRPSLINLVAECYYFNRLVSSNKVDFLCFVEIFHAS